MKIFILFFAAFALSITVSAQTGLKGIITNSHSKEALAGVTVIADDTNAVSSDLNGLYVLRLSPGKHTLVFKIIGFSDKKISEELVPGEMKERNISLEESARELNVVVVSASKFEQRIEDVTVSMEVIRPSLVENKNTTSMDDIVDQVPGVNIVDGQANIRGGAGWSYGAGSRVLVMVDDLPMLTADAGDVKWNFLPVENLEQVEVIKGASSTLFGSSALNGVINLRTAYPKSTPLTKINFFTGFYDKAYVTTNGTKHSLNWGVGFPQMNSGINFLHSRQIKNFDLVVGGNLFMDNGYREGENEHRGRFNINTRYRSKKIEGLSYGVNMNTIYIDGSLFFIWKNDTTGAYIPATNTLSSYASTRTNIDPFLTYVDNKGNTHKLRTRWFRTVNENNTDQNSTADLYYAEYQFQKRFSRQLTVTGGVVDIASRVSSELYQNHTGNNIAFYAQGDLKWKKVSFSLGARLEQNRVDNMKDKLTPVFRGGLNYHILKATYLRASVGQGYRYPSVAEKFIQTTVGGIGIFPNDSLQAEKGISAEFGIKQGMKIGSWMGYADAAAFINEYENMMEFTFSNWGKPVFPTLGYGFKSLNVGDTKIKGLEFSLMGEGEIARNLNMSVLAGYTYLDPRQTRFDSTYIKKVGTANYLGSDSSSFLKYRYEHLIRANIEFTYKKYSLGIGLRYNSFMKNIDKIFVGPLSPLFVPGVAHYRDSHKKGDTIFDLRMAYLFNPKVRLSLICKNAFNYVFMQRPADMQPPRTFVAQFSFIL